MPKKKRPKPLKGIVSIVVERGETSGYIASCRNYETAIVTQAPTLDELILNIKEAAELYFEFEDMRKLGFVRNPKVLVLYEFSLDIEHAKEADRGE